MRRCKLTPMILEVWWIGGAMVLVCVSIVIDVQRQRKNALEFNGMLKLMKWGRDH